MLHKKREKDYKEEGWKFQKKKLVKIWLLHFIYEVELEQRGHMKTYRNKLLTY